VNDELENHGRKLQSAVLRYLLSMRLHGPTKSTTTSAIERPEQSARAVLTISLPTMKKLNSSSSRQQEGG
jgi:hypothetical protein